MSVKSDYRSFGKTDSLDFYGPSRQPARRAPTPYRPTPNNSLLTSQFGARNSLLNYTGRGTSSELAGSIPTAITNQINSQPSSSSGYAQQRALVSAGKLKLPRMGTAERNFPNFYLSCMYHQEGLAQ